MMSSIFFYIYLLLMPFMCLPKPSFMGNQMQYADLVFIPIFVLFLLDLRKGPLKFFKDRINLSLVFLLVIPILSFFYSPLKTEILPNLLGLVYLVCLYFSFTSLIKNKMQFKKINLFLFALTVFVSIAATVIFIFENILKIRLFTAYVYQGANGTQSAMINFSRPSSLLVLPEMFINFLLLGLSSAFVYKEYLLTTKKPKAIRVINYCILLIIISSVLAFSRSLLGVVLFLTLLAFRFAGKNRLLAISRAILLSVFILLFVASFGLSIFTIYPVSFSVDNISHAVHVNFSSNLDTRFYLAKAALVMGNSHPFLGLGLGTFTRHFKDYLNQKDIVFLTGMRKTAFCDLAIDPHSLYFGAISEMGYPVTVLLLIIFSLILVRIKKAYLKNQEPHQKNICYIFMCSIIGYLLNGFFVDALSMRSFWVLLSLGVIAAGLDQKENKGII